MFDAIILAGGKNSELKTYDALIELNGKPMVSYVAEALRKSSQIRHIYVAGPSGQLAGCPLPSSTTVVEGGKSMIDTICLAFEAREKESENKKKEKVFVVTSDIPFLTVEAIDDFLLKSLAKEADACYAVIPKKVCEARFPGGRRTYVRLKEGRFTGGNVYLVNPQIVQSCIKVAQSIIDNRKSPLKLCCMLGWGFVGRFILGRLGLLDIESRISQILAIKGAVIVSDYPELGFDVDKPQDLELARKKII